ncbi:hypothetical protein [Streptomyces sp. NPDC014006]|uniref:hypothetical protein n=1 Tax=Streptomyces sp. NPDC014006 TaxID=3364870 RepID=UPI00370096F3
MAHWASGDGVLDVGDSTRLVHAPGHADGGIALRLPARRVLFTGHTIAASPVDGTVMPVRSPSTGNGRRCRCCGAGLTTEVACFSHREAVTSGPGEVLRAAADGHARPTRLPHPTGRPASRYSAAPRSRARRAQRSRS